MATPSTMILRSLVLLGEKSLGDTLTATEQTAYLAALNTMMESWSVERLLVYQILDEVFALTAGDGTYTIGSSGNFNTVRPTRIDGAMIRDSYSSDTILRVVGADQWRTIAKKTSTGSTYPAYLYCDYAYPLAMINLYPEPQSSLSLVISSWKQLQSFGAISTTLALPPGYERAIIYNFAIEVAGGMIEPAASVIKVARESKAAIKRVNMPMLSMSLPPMPGVSYRGGNIFTGP